MSIPKTVLLPDSLALGTGHSLHWMHNWDLLNFGKFYFFALLHTENRQHTAVHTTLILPHRIHFGVVPESDFNIYLKRNNINKKYLRVLKKNTQCVVSEKNGIKYISGTKNCVPYGKESDFILIPCKQENKLFLAFIDSKSKGLSIRKLETTTQEPQYLLHLDNVQMNDNLILGSKWIV